MAYVIRDKRQTMTMQHQTENMVTQPTNHNQQTGASTQRKKKKNNVAKILGKKIRAIIVVNLIWPLALV